MQPIVLSKASIWDEEEPDRVDTPTAQAAVRGWTQWEHGVYTVLKERSPSVVAIAEYLARPQEQVQPNPLHLKIRMTAELSDGSTVMLQVLVDTGSEVNIIKKGLVGDRLFSRSANPIRFLTASSSVLEGGEKEMSCNVLIDGIEVENKTQARAVVPITWYEADIAADAIVSLAWLSK